MSGDIFTNAEDQANEQFQILQTNEQLRAFIKKVVGENKKLRIRLQNAEQGLRDYQETGPCTLREAKEKMEYLKGANARKLWTIAFLSVALAFSIFSCHSNKKQLKTIQQVNTVKQH